MFGLFKKKVKIGKTEEEKRADAMPMTKKVQFEPQPIADIENALSGDLRAVLQFNPVNYYATKDRYVLCTFYYREDYSEIYMQFEFRRDDLPAGKSKVYTIDKVLMRDILRKFGQNINIG